MIETATYTCSICNEPSLDICVRCTKDACPNHRCARCKACSDCCECEVPLTEPETHTKAGPAEVIEATEPASEPPAGQETGVLLLPPEASEEPDLNVPPASRIDETGQPEQAPPEFPEDR